MRRPIAIVDLDDTVLDFANSIRKSLNYHFRKNFKLEELKSFNLCNLYGITLEQFYGTIVKDSLIEIAAPNPGAAEALDYLADTHEIVLCTSRGYHPEAEYLTRKSLIKHGIGFDRLIIVPEGVRKSEAYEQLRIPCAAVVFDDATHNISDLLLGSAAEAWIPEQPWNEDMSRIDRKYKGSYFKAPSFRDCVEQYMAKSEGLLSVRAY